MYCDKAWITGEGIIQGTVPAQQCMAREQQAGKMSPPGLDSS